MEPRTRSGLALLALGAAAAPELVSYDRVKRALMTRGRDAPMDTALSMIAAGSLLFYLAEKEVNPRVNSLGDAFVFVSTCMSVGYSDIYAKTEAGKAIATIVMTFGPGLAATMFDRAAPAREGG